MHLSEEQINQYLDGLLNETERQVIKAHLAVCAECRRQVDELQALLTDLEALPDLPLARDLTPSILAKLPPKWGGLEFRSTSAWTRSLAAQWGLVAGFALWLGMQMATLLNLPASLHFGWPAFNLDILPKQFSVSPMPMFQLPTFDFQMPSFFFPLSSSHLTLLLALATLLWVMGNAVLLRSRPEVQK